MRVAKGNDISSTGINLPVAPESVGPLILGTTVDIEYEWVALARIKAVRLDYEYLYLRPPGALDPHRFRRPDVHFGRHTGVNCGQPGNITGFVAGDRGAIDLGRIADGPPDEDQPPTVSGELKAVYGPVGKHLLYCLRGNVDIVYGVLALHRGGEMDRFRILTPSVIVYPVLECVSQDGRST